MRKMNYSIISVVFFITIMVVINSDSQFPNQNSLILNATDCKEINTNNNNLSLSAVEILVYPLQCVVNSELEFDSDFLKKFENLQTINVSSLEIEHFNFSWTKKNSEVKDKLNIKSFIASHNHFRVIQNDIFIYMPNISEIDFSFNRIQSLNSSNFQTDSSNFITMINCSNNAISELDQTAFSKLKNLQKLDLSSNKIKKIDTQVFVNNKLINFVNLRRNPLETFDFNIFSKEAGSVDVHLPLNDLVELDASCGQSESGIPICHFAGFRGEYSFKNLIRFNASRNHKMNVSEVLSKLGSNVEVLDLSWNFVNDLKSGAMKMFTKVKYLNLSHGNISSIESDAFYYQVWLETLDLSCNNLKPFNCDAFSKKLINLKTLILKGNNSDCNDIKCSENDEIDQKSNQTSDDSVEEENTEITTIQNATLTHSTRISWEIVLYSVIATAFCIALILLIIHLVHRIFASKKSVAIIVADHDHRAETKKFNNDSDYEEIEMARPMSFNPVPINYPQIDLPNSSESTPFVPVLMLPEPQPQQYHHYATVNKRINEAI